MSSARSARAPAARQLPFATLRASDARSPQRGGNRGRSGLSGCLICNAPSSRGHPSPHRPRRVVRKIGSKKGEIKRCTYLKTTAPCHVRGHSGLSGVEKPPYQRNAPGRPHVWLCGPPELAHSGEGSKGCRRPSGPRALSPSAGRPPAAAGSGGGGARGEVAGPAGARAAGRSAEGAGPRGRRGGERAGGGAGAGAGGVTCAGRGGRGETAA